MSGRLEIHTSVGYKRTTYSTTLSSASWSSLIPDGNVFLGGGGSVVDALGGGASSLQADSLERRASNRCIVAVVCWGRRIGYASDVSQAGEMASAKKVGNL